MEWAEKVVSEAGTGSRFPSPVHLADDARKGPVSLSVDHELVRFAYKKISDSFWHRGIFNRSPLRARRDGEGGGCRHRERSLQAEESYLACESGPSVVSD